MARAPRLQIAGGFYHVMTRGNRRQRIYVYDDDVVEFERVLTRVVRRLEWRIHGFCLMPNHYHLVVETPDANLSVGMQRLNGIYAKSFNYAHGYEGHLFERRFRSVVVEGDAHMLELARYLALNPVRAGLCGHPAEWRWSSYGALAGRAPAPAFLTCDWLLSQFGPDVSRARTRFAGFVDGTSLAP
jgi:putative transposase